MSRISGSNTKPEIIVRKMIYGMGFRYRLNVRELPGTPDIVLPKHKKVVFVHGCFWHGHKECKRSQRPSSNIGFWNKKIEQNIARDKKTIKDLKKLGWQQLIIWGCKTRNPVTLKKILANFLIER